jgi:hypothetical protein
MGRANATSRYSGMIVGYASADHRGRSVALTATFLFFGLLALIAILALSGCGGAVSTETASSGADTGGISGNGVATLSWEAPTTTVEGTPLSSLSGYRIYYGTSSGHYSAKVDNITGTSRMITGLVEGKTYYFVVTALDENGYESDYSDEVAKYVI